MTNFYSTKYGHLLAESRKLSQQETHCVYDWLVAAIHAGERKLAKQLATYLWTAIFAYDSPTAFGFDPIPWPMLAKTLNKYRVK